MLENRIISHPPRGGGGRAAAAALVAAAGDGGTASRTGDVGVCRRVGTAGGGGCAVAVS